MTFWIPTQPFVWDKLESRRRRLPRGQVRQNRELILSDKQRSLEGVLIIEKLFNIERDFSTRYHDMRTWIMKCLEPLAIVPSVLEFNSIGPRWYTRSSTDGLRNSKHFKM
ncbi:hypothetical protein GOBAR_AA04469 [Gossypium barbadense]|uniref:Uncharacterized protein n=1 Tax=Gossypium barbadense TaxID=3634 RepID=A0A2P5YKJ7_GOSBA|nr:hypothetical protein GOBAR_AA04469 [Gossypium barbadense]